MQFSGKKGIWPVRACSHSGTTHPASPDFMCLLPVAMAQYSFDSVAICLVLTVLWMASCYILWTYWGYHWSVMHGLNAPVVLVASCPRQRQVPKTKQILCARGVRMEFAIRIVLFLFHCALYLLCCVRSTFCMWRKNVEDSKHSNQHKKLAKSFHDRKLLCKVSSTQLPTVAVCPQLGDINMFAV